jgi:hypothetical protein
MGLRMTRISTLLVVALLGGMTAIAQPHLSMPAEHDWGVVVPTGGATSQHQVKARIELKNDGTAPLKIKEVRVGCGCTSAPLEKDSLQPGESTNLNVTLNLPNTNGPLSKYVTLFTNEPDAKPHVLTLKADVQRPLQLSSSFIPFNASVVGKPTLGTITVTSQNPTPVRITVTSQVPTMSVDPATPFTLQKGESKTINFLFTPAATGSFNVQAVMKTDLVGYEEIPIVGYGAVTAKESDPLPGTMKIGD